MVNQIKDSIAYYTRHNFLLYRQMEKITALESMDPSELRKLEEKEAMKMIRFAFTRKCGDFGASGFGVSATAAGAASWPSRLVRAR